VGALLRASRRGGGVRLPHGAPPLSIVSELRRELCVGIAGDEEGERRDGIDAAARKATSIEAAGFERFDAISALAQNGGDAEKALELLVSGWRPEGVAVEAAAQAFKCPFGFGAAAGASAVGPRCPFAGRGGALPPDHPPVPGMPTPAVQKSALPAALAETVRTMAERGGLSADRIAELLTLDVAAVKATLAPPEPSAGGVAPLPPALAEV